ncbi:hypothetical protein K440DRAFT_279225 [Wilcoxina mikolae CBS 423.85]|nr:hypothetical protein K440DRAFT_279225 [Wilcoxina mikolae CBS 423.85]
MNRSKSMEVIDHQIHLLKKEDVNPTVRSRLLNSPYINQHPNAPHRQSITTLALHPPSIIISHQNMTPLHFLSLLLLLPLLLTPTFTSAVQIEHCPYGLHQCTLVSTNVENIRAAKYLPLGKCYTADLPGSVRTRGWKGGCCTFFEGGGCKGRRVFKGNRERDGGEMGENGVKSWVCWKRCG